MVNITENQAIIRTKADNVHTQPSIKRWLKHSFYLKRSKQKFNTTQQEYIAQAITQAEAGHVGEIQVIIEASLPSKFAYQYDTLHRAQDLFAEYRVWDTEYNSGLLIYLNLCAHKIELVADRGINRAVTPSCWDDICQEMIISFKQDQFTEGLSMGIQRLGTILQAFYDGDMTDTIGDELSNLPRLL